MYSEGAKVSGGEDLSADTQLQTALVKDITPAAAMSFHGIYPAVFSLALATFCRHQERNRKMALGRRVLRLHHDSRMGDVICHLSHFVAIWIKFLTFAG